MKENKMTNPDRRASATRGRCGGSGPRAVAVAVVLAAATAALPASCGPAKAPAPGSTSNFDDVNAKQPRGVVTGTAEDDANGMSAGCDDWGNVVYVHPDTAAARAWAKYDCQWMDDSVDSVQSAVQSYANQHG